MQINFSTFDPTKGLVLEKETTSTSMMEVRELDHLRWIVSHDGVLHGAMSCHQPNNPILPYVRAMLVIQFIKPTAKSILNLGLGCGAIERYLKERYPNIALTSVDVCEKRLDQINKYFDLPRTCKLVIQDANEFIQQARPPQDLIYCDLFDTSDNFNTPLTKDFIHHLRKRISKSGVIAINYVFEEQNKLIATLVELRKVFVTTALIEVEGHANVIILASNENEAQLKSINSNTAMFDETYQIDFQETFNSITWLPDQGELKNLNK